MRKQDNKGFTLIELLVAVMVLAVIIVPLLHSFVTSYRVNAKSKQLMRATTLAQNEMEIFEKEEIEALKAMTVEGDPSKFVYTVTDEPNPADAADDGCYTFKREKIINDESGREMFDVVVTLNPERSGLYKDFYEADIVQMNTLSNVDSGKYVQNIRTKNNSSDYDDIVYNTFYNRREASGYGALWTLEDFEKELKRRIIINVSQENDGSGMITKAKITYEYSCEHGVMPEEYRVYTDETVMFDNAQSFDEEGQRIELKSLYLFYGPRYDSSNVDEIVIENEAKLPIDFYVIRQEVLKDVIDEDADDETNIRKTPLAYQAKISIYDGVDGNNTCGSYWTNLNIDEAEIEGTGKHVQLLLKDLNTSTQYSDATTVLEKTGLKKLGQTENIDKIYKMTVKVYQTGADLSTEEPIVTMTGTKLE